MREIRYQYESNTDIEQDGLDISFSEAAATDDNLLFLKAYDYDDGTHQVIAVPSEGQELLKGQDLRQLLDDKDFLVRAFKEGHKSTMSEDKLAKGLTNDIVASIQPNITPK